MHPNLHVKENRVVNVSGVDAAPNHGRLCVKGRFGYHFIGSPDRLTQPLIKENGSFREASWDEALGYVAQRLSAIRDSSGPDSIGVLSSARMSNEDNYMAQKFARSVLYHYHTGTMTMKSDDLNERAPECRIEIADSDASRLGIANGEMLSIRSRRGTIQARATLTPSIMPGTVFIPFHFAAAAANRLTNAALDPVCAIPELKVCAVALSPAKMDANTLNE